MSHFSNSYSHQHQDIQTNKQDMFSKRLFIIGFGSIGQALIPLIFQHFHILSQQITILTKHKEGQDIAQQFGVNLEFIDITQHNYYRTIGDRLNPGDFLVNLSVDISSEDLIKLCQTKKALYLDTCTEPWKGVYVDNQLSPDLRTNYALRESVLAFKKTNAPTAIITHGANPGLISHFVKQALFNMAIDQGLNIEHAPHTSADWANIARLLHIKTIHIAERDSQFTQKIKIPHEFVNTWSVDGFISESCQPAELGWGTHERYFPADGRKHLFGSQCAIYMTTPGAHVRIRTWVPSLGGSHGFLISHAESISLAQYLSLTVDNKLLYRPTIHYTYIPCSDAILSLQELASQEWHSQPNKRIICDDILDGEDELGVLLMGNANGAYWYGSRLSIHEARRLAPHNNATSLQVVISIIAGMKWAIKHPNLGIIEPEDMNHEFVLAIATPYLGRIEEHYSHWTPLQHREKLFKETLDLIDPWQFQNMRVF